MTGTMNVYIVLALVAISGVNSQPAGCTDIDGLYECDYSTLNGGGNIPLSSSSFSSPPAQRIRLTNIPATLTSSLFQSNFLNLDQSVTFDTNWPATLELKCTSNSAVTIGQSAFTNMGHVYDFKIINCQVTAQANAFTNLGTLDRFVIENGTIASFDAAALSGVSIKKSANPTHSFPVSTGELIFRDSIATSAFPVTFLSEQTDLVSLTLEGLWLTSIDATQFSNNTNLRFLSLGHNAMTELPSGLFDGLNSLAELHLYSLEFDCSCSKLWFYPHADTTGMKIYGDVICRSPPSWENKKAVSYYYSSCVEVPESCSGGFVLMGACITWFELAMYCVCLIAFIVGIVVLILAILLKRQVGGASSTARGKKGGAAGKKPPVKKAGPKGTKQGWN